MKHIILVFNEKAGGIVSPRQEIIDVFANFGVTCSVITPDELTAEYTKSLLQAEAIVGAGGDGTIAAAANALVHAGIDLPFGVIAVGTLNHFAKDAGLPLEIHSAVKAIVEGGEQRIDIASVNGQVFVNNSSVGLYASIVREREKYQRYLTRWPALAVAFLVVMVRLKRYKATLLIDGEERIERTSFIFVGNNAYHASDGTFNQRTSLQNGELCLYVLKTAKLLRMASVCWHAVRGQIEQAEWFDSYHAKEVSVMVKHSRAIVAYDGEITRMNTPLQYKIHPGVIRLRTPKTTLK